jgi:RNA polymerase sigma factor (sigma-70 family)
MQGGNKMLLNVGNPWSDGWREVSTHELVELLHAGQVAKEVREHAITTIYQRYSEGMVRLIAAQVNTAEDILDIHSEVWRFALERIDRFDWRADARTADPLKSWLLSIAQYKVQEHFRAIKLNPVELVEAQLTYVDRHDTFEGFDLEHPYALPDALRRQADVLLQRALNCLKPEERDVIILTYYRNLNSREIGELHRRTAVNVRVLRSRALKKLRAFLNQSVG